MKLIKQANGKRTIKMSKSEWTDIGKKAGWMDENPSYEEDKSQQENVCKFCNSKNLINKSTDDNIIKKCKDCGKQEVTSK